MPALFDAIGFTGRQTDYLVWHAGQYSRGTTLNLSADALAVRLLEAMRATVPA
jgi:hypothetical protein